jgi:predicted metal-dependent hydrolase
MVKPEDVKAKTKKRRVMSNEFKIVKKRKRYTDIRRPDGSVVTYSYPPITAMKYAKEDYIQAKHDYGVRGDDIDTSPQDAPQSTLSFRHKLILARDDNTLAAHQGAGNKPKIDLFDLKTYQQKVMAI